MYCLWCRYCQYWHQLSPEPDEKVRGKGKIFGEQLEANFFCEVVVAAVEEDGGFLEDVGAAQPNKW